MKKIIGNIRPYVKETVFSPLLKMFEALLELIVPLIIASIIDVGISGGDKAYIIKNANHAISIYSHGIRLVKKLIND